MRRLVYGVAVSVDGFIAGPADDVAGFLGEGEHVDAYFVRMAAYDTVLMGRRTYEYGYAYGMKPGDRAYPHMRHLIFSTSIALPDKRDVEVVRDDVLAAIDALKAGEGGDIYLCGGGALAGFLMANRRIDRVILKVNPLILGAGTPLFGGFEVAEALRLEGATPYVTRVTLLEYGVSP